MSQRHFTRLGRYVPEVYYGKKYDWFATYPPYQETLYYVGPLMQSAAQGIGLLKPHLTAQELQIAKAWGQELFENSKNIKISPRAADVMSSVASGYATWAAVTGDRQIMRQAQKLYKQALNGINRQGIHDLVAKSGVGKEERELKYTHMIYGFMTVAAWAIEESGGKAFGARGSSGGTLIDGLNFHLAASFFPDRRRGISPVQKEIDYTRRSRDVYWGTSKNCPYLGAAVCLTGRTGTGKQQ